MGFLFKAIDQFAKPKEKKNKQTELASGYADQCRSLGRIAKKTRNRLDF
jgi:hypothetical protein